MELTRRDAVAALAALGGVGATPFAVSRTYDGAPSEGVSEKRVRETFRAVAAVVYPSELSGIDGFVEEFLDGRLAGETHAAGIREAVALLDERAESWHGARASELPPESLDRLLREIGADTADERPDGSDAERVRYFVVNELLLALYSSPTGGELVGTENPQGYPGGTDSYQRGPR